MKTPPSAPHSATYCRALTLAVATQLAFLITVPAQNPIDLVPVVSIRASVPETREPFCDPAICDAALPPPGVLVLTRRGGDLSRELFVSMSYAGTASSGTDYPALPVSVGFPAKEASVELFVEAVYDKLVEGDEYVAAQVLPDPSVGPVERYRIDPERSSARVTIHDNETPPAATLEITNPKDGANFVEGTPILINATAIDPNGAITHVDFFDGDVKIGESILVFIREPDPGTPIYHEFEWHRAATGLHTLTARALDDAGNLATSAPVRITVGGDLPVVSIEATVPETTEPSPTIRVRPGVFTLRRTGDPATSLKVWMHYAGTATSGADYDAPPAIAEFPAGAASVEISIGAFDDELVEGDETVIAEVTPSPLAIPPTYRIDPAHNEARVVIHDNEDADRPVVSIRPTQPITAEPCPVCLVVPGVFTIYRTGPTDAPLAVWYLLGGSALNGVDYERLPGQTNIPAGRDSVEVRVLPFLDDLREGDETVVAQLIVPPFASPADAPIDPYSIEAMNHRATVFIRDSLTTPPGPPIVSICAPDPFAREGAEADRLNSATFVVNRAGETNDALTVLYDIGGTASNGTSYASIPDQLTIPAGQRKVLIVINPIEDNLSERIETVVIALRPRPIPLPAPLDSPAYTLGAPARAAAVIVDKNQPRPPTMMLPDGLFNLSLRVDVYNCFRVETTADFKAWTPLCTLPVNEGSVHFVDPDAPELPHRFYRLIPVACEPEE